MTYRPIASYPRLVVRLGEGKELHFDLDAPVITVGRDPQNRIVLPHALVSLFHAKLFVSDGIVRLVDLESTNRTRVNGRPVADAILRYGDEIQFARIKCRLLPPAGEATPGRAAVV